MVKSKQASATVYLMEELGDARMRCDQLLRYLAQAGKIIESSPHKDLIYEVGGHLIEALPATAFKLHKALQATALAANRVDTEEIKQELRPEKVEQLEQVLKEVRLHSLPRHSASRDQVMKQASLSIKELQEVQRALEDIVLDARAIKQDAPPDLKKVLQDISQRAQQALKGLKLASRVAADESTEPDTKALIKNLQGILDDAEGAMAGSPDFIQAGLAEIIELATNSIKKTKTASCGNCADCDCDSDSDGQDKQASLDSDLADIKQGLKEDQKMLSRYQGYIRDLKDGKEVENLTSQAAERVLSVLSQAIDNKMRLVKQMARNASDEEQSDTEQDKPEGQDKQATRDWKASLARMQARLSSSESLARFEEGEPADPTENMSQEDAAEWDANTEEYGDMFKTASEFDDESVGGEEVLIPGALMVGAGYLFSTRAVIRALTIDGLSDLKRAYPFGDGPFALGSVDPGPTLVKVRDIAGDWDRQTGKLANEMENLSRILKRGQRDANPIVPSLGYKGVRTPAADLRKVFLKAIDTLDNADNVLAAQIRFLPYLAKKRPGQDPRGRESASDIVGLLSDYQALSKSLKEGFSDLAASLKYLSASDKVASYAGDPHWITAKFPGKDQDGTAFKKGERVLYWPRSKVFQVGAKAEAAMRRFEAEIADEAFEGFRSAKVNFGEYHTRNHTAADLTTESQLTMLKSHPPKVEAISDDDGGELWAIQCFSPVLRKYTTLLAVVDQADAQDHLAFWEKEHKKALKSLKTKTARFEEGEPADPTENMSQEDAESKMLTTDGKVLEKNGMGGKGFAKWEDDKIVVHPSRPQVKNDEEVLRYMKKAIPAGILKMAAGVLWKYTDESGKDFYLAEKKVGMIKSPFSGKGFPAKPEKLNMGGVGKELKEDGAKTPNALWKYTDSDGGLFWLGERLTGTIKSPFSGKGFSAKPEKGSLTDVGAEAKGEAKKATLDLFALVQADQEGQDDQGQDKTAASLSIAAQLKALTSHPPKLVDYGDSFAVIVYAPAAKKYIPMCDYDDKERAEQGLRFWEGDHTRAAKALAQALTADKQASSLDLFVLASY